MDKKKALMLASVITVLFLGFAQSASAEIERGQNFDREFLGFTPDGSIQFKWVSHPERIPDFVDSKGKQYYINYKWYEDSTNITFESATISFSFSKTECGMRIYEAGRIQANQSAVVDWYQVLLKQAPNGTMDWTDAPVNSATCIISSIVDYGNGITFNSTKQNSDGIFNIIRYVDYRTGYEDYYEYTNTNPNITDIKYGYTAILNSENNIQVGDINIQRDMIRNEIVLDKETIQNKQIHIKTGGRDLIFDPKNLAHDTLFLQRVKPAQDVFDFTDVHKPLLPNQKLIVDPTFSSSNPTVDGFAREQSGNDICDDSDNYSDTDIDITIQFGAVDTGAGADCLRAYVEWNISSIPDSATITNSSIKFEVTAVAAGTITSEIRHMDIQPSTTDASNRWLDMGNGTVYVTNSAAFETTGTNKEIDLGTTADTDIQNRLTNDWFALGFKGQDETVDATDNHVELASENDGSPEPAPTLEITYLAEFGAPTNLSCVGIPFGYQCGWTANNASAISGYYIAHSPDNSTWSITNQTLIGNVTSYDYTEGSFGILESNYIRVNATENNLSNSTSSNVVLATTDNIPDAPSLSLIPLNTTSINATSTAGASDGGDTVTDYALRCEINRTGGWNNLVTNSSLPANRAHVISSLWTEGDLIICQWRDGNDVGWSAWSVNATYPARPDAVTDLEVVGVFQTTAEIRWTEPELHGLNLTGYQVNFTSPWGIPTTEITTTNSSDTEYIVTGLNANTQYSMRVSAVTLAGINTSGNIVNFATPTNFTVGEIDIDVENPLRFPIRFAQSEINSTTTSVTVTYDNEYEIDCSMYFEFAQDSQNFTGINGTAANDDEDEAVFYFITPGNEIIQIDCTDQITNDTGRYILTQSDFQLLTLFANFRAGEYGTSGQFGALDLITLFGIIIGMIGFNRTNPSVGAVFMFFIIGGLAAFGIVQWYTIVSGLVAMVLLLAYASTTKQD